MPNTLPMKRNKVAQKKALSKPLVWPGFIQTEAELDEVMTRPSLALVEMMRRLKGDLMILGIAGKMGVTLGMLALRACKEARVQKRIIGVSRFSDPRSRRMLEEIGLETIQCDLLDRESVSQLPQVENVIFMAGRKFGTTDSEALTWVMNTLVPGNVAHHFQKSRVVVFSTACVYPLVDVATGGCLDDDLPDPVGDYAQSCLGRERVFSYYSQTHKMPALIFRLSYAIDLRYGVLHELARKIWQNKPIDVTMGYANVIWQGDANSQALLSLEHCSVPAKILNVTGRKIISIREVATGFGKLMGRKVKFTGKERKTALVINSKQAEEILEKHRVTLRQMMEWTAHWVAQGGATLDKPTHFEVRNGKY